MLFVFVVHVNASTTGQVMPDFHSFSPCQLLFSRSLPDWDAPHQTLLVEVPHICEVNFEL